MFFGSLCIHIGPYRFERSTADTAHKVGPVPEQRFAVELGNVFGKAVSGPSRTGRFQVVNQHRNTQGRMDVDQQVDVIRFAAIFDQFAVPGGEAVREGFLEVLQHFGRERSAPVFGHKNYM